MGAVDGASRGRLALRYCWASSVPGVGGRPWWVRSPVVLARRGPNEDATCSWGVVPEQARGDGRVRVPYARAGGGVVTALAVAIVAAIVAFGLGALTGQRRGHRLERRLAATHLGLAAELAAAEAERAADAAAAAEMEATDRVRARSVIASLAAREAGRCVDEHAAAVHAWEAPLGLHEDDEP